MAQRVKDLALSLCGSGHCYGSGLIPGMGTSTCCRHGQKKKKKKNESHLSKHVLSLFWTALSESPSQDSLDAFMSEMKSGSALDGVSRKKLHLRTFELRKEQQRLKGLIKIVKPAEIPELKK